MSDGQPLLTKFFGVQDLELYGGHVAGRSMQGFPIIGETTPNVTQDEMENMPLYSRFRSGWFRMWDPGEKAQFDKIMDHVYNGEFFVKHRHDVPVPGYPEDEPGGSLKVWLEWVQVEARPRNWSNSSPMPTVPAFSANVHVPTY